LPHVLAFADCLTCRAVCEPWACRELGMRCGISALPPSSQSRIRQSSSGSAGQAVSKSGVKTSSHSPSHRKKSLVHTSRSAHQLPSKNASSTALHTTSHLPTDRYHNQRTTGGKNNNVVPKYILRSRMSPCGPSLRQTSALRDSIGSVHLVA